MPQQRHPRKKLKIRPRIVYGTVSSPIFGKIGIEEEAWMAAYASAAVLGQDGIWHIKNAAVFFTALKAAALARADLAPEPPQVNAPLNAWFEWQDVMHTKGQICGLEDIARNACRTYETVKKAHEVYLQHPKEKDTPS